MKNNNIRHIARLQIETQTPLGIGSGNVGLENERLIARDVNELPYIPGTSLAGVLRHLMAAEGMDDAQLNLLFGFQKSGNVADIPEKDKGQGSRIALSAGKMLAPTATEVLDGLDVEIDWSHPYYMVFDNLPERDHVKINHKGTATKHGKFMEQLVPKGTRFVFEVELNGTSQDDAIFQQVLTTFKRPEFRLGAGTRKGFGDFKVIRLESRRYDLKDSGDLMAYLNKSSSLNDPFEGAEVRTSDLTSELGTGWKKFSLSLRPVDFFLFSSGNISKRQKGDQISWLGALPKMEQHVEWGENGVTISMDKWDESFRYMIPGTSIKGALAHRVAYHYNKLSDHPAFIENTGNFELEGASLDFNFEKAIEQLSSQMEFDALAGLDLPADSPEWKIWEQKISELSVKDLPGWVLHDKNISEQGKAKSLDEFLPVMENNEAVRTLFGYAKDGEGEEQSGQRGHVIIPDIYLNNQNAKTHSMMHVAIDRFTGGASAGALFEEEVLFYPHNIDLTIWVEGFDDMSSHIQQAFKETLEDLKAGQLPLGGNTSKGHGVFVAATSS